MEEKTCEHCGKDVLGKCFDPDDCILGNRPVDRVVSVPIAEPGLCIRNEKKGATVNVHFVRDGQVYYGMYKNDETGLDGTAVELSRMDTHTFNSLLVKAAIDGHSLFNLVAH